MIIDCTSDLHGYFPKLEGGDFLIVAGDLTARDTHEQYNAFCDWLDAAPYRCKVVIAGNHDNKIDKNMIEDKRNCHYLCDCAMEFYGLTIWGSPWTKTFFGMNPHCMAFTKNSSEELSKIWELIPEHIDILITHSPPQGIFDANVYGEHCGCSELSSAVSDRIRPKLHVFGHIHEGGGQVTDIEKAASAANTTSRIKFVNASFVNEHYRPVHKPIRVIM